MTETVEAPRIYVASLTDYNAGILHGRWIDATLGAKLVNNEIDVMLADSPTAKAEGVRAEEWAIHDTDGFWHWVPWEFERLPDVCAAAELIAEHGEPAGVWLANRGGVYESEDAADLDTEFRNEFCEVWESGEDYAMELAEDCGYVAASAEWPCTCIDWGHAWRELRHDGYWSERVDGGDAIFHA